MFVHTYHLWCMHHCISFTGNIIFRQQGSDLVFVAYQNQVCIAFLYIVLNTLNCFKGGKIATHHVNSYLHSYPKIKNPCSRQSAEDGFCKKDFDYFLIGEVSATTCPLLYNLPSIT